MTKEEQNNRFLFMAAIVWKLNNPDTKMNIPNAVYISLEKKLKKIPTDRLMTEREALDLV